MVTITEVISTFAEVDIDPLRVHRCPLLPDLRPGVLSHLLVCPARHGQGALWILREGLTGRGFFPPRDEFCGLPPMPSVILRLPVLVREKVEQQTAACTTVCCST